MSNHLYKLKFLKHCFLARNTKGYGVHSPFLFDFTQSVIREKQPFYSFPRIERMRRKLWIDARMVPFENADRKRVENKSVSYILRKCSPPRRCDQLLFRTVSYLKAKNILELRTSLGLTTCYLASVGSDVDCVTMESNAALAAIARENFFSLDLKNIRMIQGNIDELLPLIISQFPLLDMVFINIAPVHGTIMERFELCLQKKHNDSVFVIAGIHRSDEMQQAWRQIKAHAEVTSTIDLFEMGFVFFNKYLAKKNYKMRF